MFCGLRKPGKPGIDGTFSDSMLAMPFGHCSNPNHTRIWGLDLERERPVCPQISTRKPNP